MKKKRFLFFSTFILLISFLTGCLKTTEGQGKQQEAEGKLKIIATGFVPYDFARQIAGEYASVTMLVPPGAESHSYEPTPQDIISIQNCDIFIYGGGESDSWVTDILEAVGQKDIQVVKMMDCVTVVEEEIVEGMQETEHHEDEQAHHEEEHHEEAEYDEHVWTSPKNAVKIAEAIFAAVSKCDAVNIPVYEANKEVLVSELTALDAAFQEVVDGAVRKEIIFADRFPLRYFADAYGLSYYAAFPGCSTETEPSAATVAFLIDKVKEDEIPVVFHIELSNEKMADTICEATGARKLLFSSGHNVSKAEFESGITYLELMKDNVEALREALN